jgi:hypothetical protein
MEKRSLCTLGLLAIFCAAPAQPTFMKMYQGVGTAKFNLNELTSGNLRVGMAYQSGTSLIDPLGNVLQSQCYAVDTFLVLQAIKKYSDNKFYFVGGYRKDTCSISGNLRGYPIVGGMDSLGNILNANYYDLNTYDCSNVAGNLEVTDENEVIVWGTRNNRFFAFQTDSAGNTIWVKRFHRFGAFQFIKELPGGDLLAGINMDTAGAVVARLDQGGNFIWCKSYIRPKGMIHDCLIQSDDSFVITGFTDSITGGLFLPPPPPISSEIIHDELKWFG